ncbi:hypothetical protein [Bradyrhizobium sp. 2S1]|uniref:hypothetical protein n=1 Tax=Bradyrhizobium sp. 2S1 TaxID=1404429 RepID=UPI00289B16BA|nr:hypothetical protein [Bradyrhizobium sp. 2S1]
MSEGNRTFIAFLGEEICRDVRRDRRTVKLLHELGWKVVVIWECETKKEASLRKVVTSRIAKRKIFPNYLK